MKSVELWKISKKTNVAPFAGAWIEISNMIPKIPACSVAPPRGAWIEIFIVRHERTADAVAPLAGGVD